VVDPNHPGAPVPVRAAVRAYVPGHVGLRDQLRTQRILAEPIGTQRQDHIGILDIRVEKYFRLATARQLGAFFDVYNITNSDAAQNITWNSGSAYRLPTSVIGPTIMRFGVKLDC
jgi:hypothetical protein